MTNTDTTQKENEEWENSHDYKQAIFAANKLLDEAWADPDDDPRTVARQFLRMVERYDALSSQRQRVLVEVNALEIRSEQRYMSDSGFWSKRELIDKKEVMKILQSDLTKLIGGGRV